MRILFSEVFRLMPVVGGVRLHREPCVIQDSDHFLGYKTLGLSIFQ